MPPDPKVELFLRLSVGMALVFVGAFLVALSLGYQPSNKGELHVPDWIAALAGVIMAAGGFAFMLPNRKVAGWALAMLILAGFGATGLWVGLLSDPGQIAGGLPFLPPIVNQTLGRIAFTLGGLFCLVILVYGLWLGPAGRARKDN